MKLKLDENGNAVLQDGSPVYVYDDGREAAIDVADLAGRFSALQADAKKAFAAREEVKKELAAFDGLDAETARKAVETLTKLDQSKLVDTGKVDQVLAEAKKAFEAQLEPISKERDALRSQLVGEVVGGAFARSKYLAEKTVLPADLAQAAFGKHFKVENGKLAAFDGDGNPIFSRSKPGHAAEFDEAIEILVDAYPRKDSILKADNKPGSGAPNGGGGGGGSKSIPRAAFDSLDPASRAAHVQGGGTVTD